AAGDPHPYDVLEYHLELPREWYQQGRITRPMHNAFGFFPFNAEMQYLLAMHVRGGPWRGMFMAQFMSLMYAVLMVVGVYGVSSRLFGKGESGGAVRSAVAAAVAPWTAMLACVAYNESALMLYTVLAVGWAAVGRFGGELVAGSVSAEARSR